MKLLVYEVKEIREWQDEKLVQNLKCICSEKLLGLLIRIQLCFFFPL